jgi:predicted ATPase
LREFLGEEVGATLQTNGRTPAWPGRRHHEILCRIFLRRRLRFFSTSVISEIQIENFKSIAKLALKPGRITVLIGENGSGKSNILEAIAFAAAASANKLDDEFLFNRGIRVTEMDWMTSAFVKPVDATAGKPLFGQPISLRVAGTNADRPLEMKISRAPSLRKFGGDRWAVGFTVPSGLIEEEMKGEGFVQDFENLRQQMPANIPPEVADQVARIMVAQMKVTQRMRKSTPEIAAALALRDFLIYAPENSVLRNFETEGAIKPLGTKGEGLLKLLSTMAATGNGKFSADLKSHLGLLGWFGDVQIPTEEDEAKGRLRIRDKWLPDDFPVFDQRSANEGFLYLLFYFTLFLSKQTPVFFAIDNIDNSLNPKLCAELMRQIAILAAKSGKQVICTTHNPAVLDGLDLKDDQQRLYVVRRDSEGLTTVNRVNAPRPRPDGPSIRLSAAFMSGMLGGVPEHF